MTAFRSTWIGGSGMSFGFGFSNDLRRMRKMATSSSTGNAPGVGESILKSRTPGTIRGVATSEIPGAAGCLLAKGSASTRRISMARLPSKGLALDGGGSILKPPIPGAIRGEAKSAIPEAARGAMEDSSRTARDDGGESSRNLACPSHKASELVELGC